MTKNYLHTLFSHWRLSAWLWVVNSFIFALVLTRNLSFQDVPVNGLYYLYAPLAFIAQGMMFALVPLLILCVISLLPLKYKWFWPVALIVNASSFLIVAVNTQIYSLYRFHLDPFFIQMFIKDFGGFGFSGLTLFLLGLLVIVVLVSEYGVIQLRQKYLKGKYIISKVVIVMLMWGGLFVGQVIHAYGFEVGHSEITSLTKRIPYYFPLTAGEELLAWGLIDKKGEHHHIRLDENFSEFDYPKQSLSCVVEEPKAKNIIVLSLESWRSDAMNEKATPFIYSLANNEKTGVSFSNHLSGGNVTTKGLFSLFYALSPVYWDAALNDKNSPEFFELLKRNDYNFYIIANQDIERTEIKQVIFNEIPVIESRGYGEDLAGDSKAVDTLLDAIDNKSNGNPFFGFLLFNSTHHPYNGADYSAINSPYDDGKPIELSLVDNDTDATPYWHQHLNAAYGIDQQIKRLFGELRKRNLLDNTLVVITSDHGEEFNDNKQNYWGHGSNFTRYQLSVPLVMHWPNKTMRWPNDELRKVRYRTTHLDVLPTITKEWLGCNSDFSLYSQGVSLFSEKKRTLMVASYINKALIVEDNSYALMLGYVESYKLSDINQTVEFDSSLFDEYTRLQNQFRK